MKIDQTQEADLFLDLQNPKKSDYSSLEDIDSSYLQRPSPGQINARRSMTDVGISILRNRILYPMYIGERMPRTVFLQRCGVW